jgi:hypothetical protein
MVAVLLLAQIILMPHMVLEVIAVIDLHKVEKTQHKQD